jgi:hypothetical protein
MIMDQSSGRDEVSFSLDHYRRIISEFRLAGYSFCKFRETEQQIGSQPRLYLRHDVDIDVDAALEMAGAEHQDGIFSTYFFLIRSPFYNLLSPSCASALNQMYMMGHDIALHVDLTLYEDNKATSVMDEQQVLMKFYPFANTNVVSVHRPGDLDSSNMQRISFSEGVQNASSRIIFGHHTEYISDSTGQWRFECPLRSHAFRERNSIQLLTHPVWWIRAGDTPAQKIKNFLDSRQTTWSAIIREHLPALYASNKT